jgi:adenylate cyclase
MRESARHWSRVRDLAAALPEATQTDETRGLRLIAITQMIVHGFRLGLSEVALEALYEEGRDLAEASGNTRALLVLRGAYASRFVTLGRVSEAFAVARESLALADDFGDLASRVGARLSVTYSSLHLGRVEEALSVAEEAAELAGDDLEMGRETFGFGYRVWFTFVRGMLVGQLGRVEESMQHQARADQLARESGLPENLGWACGSLATVAEFVGEVAPAGLGDARTASREAVEIAQQLGSAFSRVVALRSLGQALILAGELEEASAALGEALVLAREQRVALEYESLLLSTLARARVTSDPAASRRLAEEAVALARERSQRLMEIAAQIALAHALLAEPSARGLAREAVERAEALVGETGARFYLGPIAEVRAALSRAGGDAPAAERHLRDAHEHYERIGATAHARRLARALGI